MKRTAKYHEWTHGVINAIEPSELPPTAVYKSQNCYFKDKRWRKLPGAVEINETSIGNDVWGLHKFHLVTPDEKYVMASAGPSLYRFLEHNRTFQAVYNSLSIDGQIEFLEYPPFLYFGSDNDLWRKYDGGTITYPIGGSNGTASDAPRKFSRMIFNPYSGRFHGIGKKEDPDILFHSEHIDNEGIEKWLDANTQIIESVRGDTPKELALFEGQLAIFNQNSIHSGNVVGVPSNWRYERQRSQTGTVARRTVKRWGSSFFMLTPDFEVYQWPDNKFVTKGRVVFDINEYKAHLACAEIVNNRYYYLSFVSGDATPNNEYHLWIYDIFADAWYGPHLGYNLNSMYWDTDKNLLLMGGASNLRGFVMEHRGRDIKNAISSVHWVTGYDFQGDNERDKRYSMLRVKAKQEGNIPVSGSTGQGQLEVLMNFDQNAWRQTSQTLTLEDPSPQNTSGTGQVKDAILLRGRIHESFGRGSSSQIEFKHNVQKGYLEWSNLELDFYFRTKKEARAT